ncbi:hypothetical protein [Vibrio rotiferianus]|uniref:hypothetical protein n=1 Tax=Vibrio rotiferianus TaxID=190895 RepID=UPI001F0E4DFE|nr:hypothetical protein [Vibrio rotiferianus]
MRLLLKGILSITTLLGCASVPIASIYKLMTLDALGVVPSEVRVATKTPDYFEVTEVDLKIISSDKGGKAQEIFPLVLDVAATPSEEVLEDLRINERLYSLSLSDQDLSRLTASLNKIRTERAEGQSDKEYSLGITIVNGGVRSEQPIKFAPASL